MIKRLYHYTTLTNLKRIINSGCLKPSYFSRHDTIHGEGWYLTDLTPSNSDITLQKYLWNTKIPEKIKCYVAFDIDEMLIKRCKDHVFLLPINSIPIPILDLDTEYFEKNAFGSLSNSKIVLKCAGYKVRKRSISSDNQDWMPLLKIAAIFIGIVGIAALLTALTKSK
jgi:hypothetical protein